MLALSSRFRGLTLFVLVSLVAATRGACDDRRVDTSRLSIMTYNAEFLFDGVAPEEGAATVDFPWKGDPVKAEQHMGEVAKVIIACDADIVSLCEVENLQALKALNDKYLQNRGYKAYLVNGGDTATGQDVALLSRIDPEGDLKYDERKGTSGRVQKSVTKNYTARLHVGDLKLALIGAHLLAQPGQESRRFQREAQAQALRSMAVEQADAGYDVVVLGDFNDYEWSDDARDHVDSQPVSNVLRILRQMKQEGETTDDLYNVAAHLPKGQRYTSWWDKNDDNVVQAPGELTSIDHMLVSQRLKGAIDIVEFPHSTPAGLASDHFPLVTRLRTTPVTSVAGSANRVRIVSLIPNAAGDETKNEQITLKNFGSADASLVGWKVRDLTGKFWKLDELGSLAASSEKFIKRSGQLMALSNGGDTLELVAASGVVVQTIVYPSFAGRDDEGDAFDVSPEFASDAPAAPVTPTEASSILIGALNIEWLGKSGSRASTGKNVAQTPEDLAAYIKQSGVAILALEEICDDDGVAAKRTNKTLDQTCEALNANGTAKWKYRLFEKHPTAEQQDTQLTGLAWNESVVTPAVQGAAIDEHRLALSVPTGETVGTATKPAFERWATAMKFSAGTGKTDVVVIPVHMKSNRPAYAGQDVVHQRVVESRMLITALQDVGAHFKDTDIVIIGDTNILKASEPTVGVFTNASFADLNASDLVTWGTASSGSPFDRAFVPSAAGNPMAIEFGDSKLDVFHHGTFSNEDFRKRISDHRMIRVRVAITEDDDTE